MSFAINNVLTIVTTVFNSCTYLILFFYLDTLIIHQGLVFLLSYYRNKLFCSENVFLFSQISESSGSSYASVRECLPLHFNLTPPPPLDPYTHIVIITPLLSLPIDCPSISPPPSTSPLASRIVAVENIAPLFRFSVELMVYFRSFTSILTTFIGGLQKCETVETGIEAPVGD